MDCVIYMFVYAMPSQEITSSKKEHYLYQDPSDVVFTMSSEVNINEAQAHSAHIHSHTDGTLATLHNTNTTSLSITENTLPCDFPSQNISQTRLHFPSQKIHCPVNVY